MRTVSGAEHLAVFTHDGYRSFGKYLTPTFSHVEHVITVFAKLDVDLVVVPIFDNGQHMAHVSIGRQGPRQMFDSTLCNLFLPSIKVFADHVAVLFYSPLYLFS